MEQTLILMKPDALQRRLVGAILARFEQRGLQIVALKMIRLTTDEAREHYSAHQGKDFYEPLVRYVASGPLVAAVLVGKNAVTIVRDMMGKTFGVDSPPGTIRGDFALSNRYNLIHGSDAPETAREEIARFFRPEEIHDWDAADLPWVYDVTGPEIV
jgi:nucleoside-diphosphate kinase